MALPACNSFSKRIDYFTCHCETKIGRTFEIRPKFDFCITDTDSIIFYYEYLLQLFVLLTAISCSEETARSLRLENPLARQNVRMKPYRYLWQTGYAEACRAVEKADGSRPVPVRRPEQRR